jgi:hypothetical protein
MFKKISIISITLVCVFSLSATCFSATKNTTKKAVYPEREIPEVLKDVKAEDYENVNSKPAVDSLKNTTSDEDEIKPEQNPIINLENKNNKNIFIISFIGLAFLVILYIKLSRIKS